MAVFVLHCDLYQKRKHVNAVCYYMKEFEVEFESGKDGDSFIIVIIIIVLKTYH